MSLPRLLNTLPIPLSLLTKLQKHGLETEQDVLNMSPLELGQELAVSQQEATGIIRRIQNLPSAAGSSSAVLHASSSGTSALDLLRAKRSKTPILTLSQDLDNMLGGGIMRGEVTEFCGVPGMGKTQIGIQLACNVQIPKRFSGAGGQAVYIDTEGSFMPERAAEIAQGLIDTMHRLTAKRQDLNKLASQITIQSILSNIYVFRVYDYVEQISCVKTLPTFLKQHPEVRLVVMDSVSFHFRRDFEDMAVRTRLLIGLSQQLLGLSEEFDVAVVLTNQVTTQIHTHTSHIVPALGETWAHACTNRVMLTWDNKQRMARLIKSPSQKEVSVPFFITPAGIRGVRQVKRKAPSVSEQAPQHNKKHVASSAGSGPSSSSYS